MLNSDIICSPHDLLIRKSKVDDTIGILQFAFAEALEAD